MRLILASFSILILAGCSAGSCGDLQLKQYTKPEQQAIVKEWNTLPDNSNLLSPLNDWERMRTTCR